MRFTHSDLVGNPILRSARAATAAAFDPLLVALTGPSYEVLSSQGLSFSKRPNPCFITHFVGPVPLAEGWHDRYIPSVGWGIGRWHCWHLLGFSRERLGGVHR